MLIVIYQFMQCNIPEDLIFSIITVRASNITLYILLVQNNLPELNQNIFCYVEAYILTLGKTQRIILGEG